ncbi:putative bifunctional diguanylate cyclase/phosphodiesterase [Azorhizobium doebereinerae]|uniref:putative bifunctional diguanylate cyclase/phosphodiesterase n=1 Tax=Azorhizobium doebereinerae TaxID=281091 RepID=UPI000415AC4E|nr:EAL domain-containing protein [Azorhizobium doebereinerae]
MAIALVAAGLVALLVWGLLRTDVARAEQERSAVRAFLTAHTAHMLQALKSATVRAEQPAVAGEPLSEAWFERSFSRPLNDTFGFEENFLLNSSGDVLYASSLGKRLAPEAVAQMRPTLKKLVEGAQAQNPSVGVVANGALTGLAAVGAVLPGGVAGAAARASTEPVYAVTVDRLDENLFKELGASFKADGFRLAEGTVLGGAGVPLTDMADGRVLSLVWPEGRPDSALTGRLAPSVALLSTLLLVLCVVLLFQARRATAALVESEAYATHLASRDVLTDLPNRMQFIADLERAFTDLDPSESLGLMFVDLDGFKDINDTLGHTAGDALLRTVAERLREGVGRGGVAARFGGDEFVLMTRGQAGDEMAPRIDHILDRLKPPIKLEGAELVVGASVGVAQAPRDATNVPDLLRRADIALYRAKAKGRGAAVLFEPHFERELRRRRNIETELSAALDRGELALVFQPEVEVETRRIVGFEALLRWDHPERGRLMPADFLWVAEGTALITRIDAWVLRKACIEARALGDTTLAVNMSPVNLRHASMVDRVMQILKETGFPPHRLEIEITESAVIGGEAEVTEMLERLRDCGIRLALDDFGTGHASLVHVHRLPVSKIKIDRSFISNLGVTRDAASIVEYVVRLGRSLGITLTAEGVESEEQLRFLRAFGAQQAQGFLFAAALPIGAAVALFDSNRRAHIPAARPGRGAPADRLV